MVSPSEGLPRAFRAYGLAAGCVVLSTLCAHLVQPYGHLADQAMILLLGARVNVEVEAMAGHPADATRQGGTDERSAQADATQGETG